LFAAEFEPADSKRRRREKRASSGFEAQLSFSGSGRAVCQVLDFSIHGARLQTYSELERGTLIWLALPGIGRRVARVVWTQDFEAGLEFQSPLSAKAFKVLSSQ
jgi:hypothetical protein